MRLIVSEHTCYYSTTHLPMMPILTGVLSHCEAGLTSAPESCQESIGTILVGVQ